MNDTITKRDMARRIAVKLDEPLAVVQTVLQAVLDGIIEDLANGDRIELRGFGIFETRTRPGRLCYHFGKHERMEVPPKIVGTFKPGSEMKKRIGEMRDEQESDGKSGGDLRQGGA